MAAFADVLTALLAISSSFLAHEFGHFLIARLSGVRVERFSIGLGQELVGMYDRFGTRLSISAIPIAGFVRFYRPTDSHETKAAGIPYEQSNIGNRISIVLAGPLFSILFAYLLSAASIYWYSSAVEPVVGGTTVGGPADRAGVKAGDRILSVNGATVRTFSDIQQAIQYTQENFVTLVIQRDGAIIDIALAPEMQELETERSDCLFNVRIVGMRATDKPHSPLFVEALRSSGADLGRMAYQTLYQSIISVIPRSFQTCSMAEPARLVPIRTRSFLMELIAALSLSYAVFNLLPLPFLDGAELLFCSAILIRGRPLRQRTQDRISSLAFWGIFLYGLLAGLITILR